MDSVGNNCHVVGINIEKRMIYDCQEKNLLPLSLKTLSYCCGPNRHFPTFITIVRYVQTIPPKYKVKFIYDVISN